MTVRLAVGIMRAALDCIIVMDSQSHVVEWNEAAAHTFGYSRDEAIGAELAQLIIPPDLRDAHYAGIAKYLATKSGPILNQRIEVPALRRDGTIIPVELAVVPIDEEPPRFAAYLRDISDRKAAEEALAQSEAHQRLFLRDILLSVTEGRLRLCTGETDLPVRLTLVGQPINLSSETLRLVRRHAEEAAEQAQLEPVRRFDFLTATSEAAMNAVVHAGGGVAFVGVDKEAGIVQAWIEDKGKGIEMRHLPRATLDRGYTTAGTLGYGFKLTLTTADTVWLLTGPLGTTVVVEQNRTAPAHAWVEDGPPAPQ